MKDRCPRAFEAEALRDGRLAGAERANFERHVGTCSACAAEVRGLETLGAALRGARVPGDHADELHVRRERMRLLASFDRGLVAREPGGRARHWLVAAVALVAMCGAVFLLYSTESSNDASTAVVVHADGRAEWSRHVEGSVERVVLVHGALSIRVEDSAKKRRLLVVLPDGELEDIGTTFTVSAEAGRTTRVSVESGSVVLRLRGKSLVALGAGQTWVPEPPAPPEAQPTSESDPPPPAEPSASVARLPRLERANTPAATALPKPASIDFRAAIALLDAGEHRKAAARFAAFVSHHAGDARVEDAAYLRVIALQRAGDTAAMQGAAREYLRRHPNGFRRAEVSALVQ